MRTFTLPSILAGVLLAAGCSNGSSTVPDAQRDTCPGGQSFCLLSCDLGCTQTGCAITEVAENQRLRFRFSDRVDASSVSLGSISIRTAAGSPPDGTFSVVGSEVTFLPQVRTSGGVSTFGFLRNESYIVTLAGGPSGNFGVRSVSGDTLTQELSCTVTATRGIVDENQQSPSVELVSPTDLSAVPLNPTIVLRFSELIDPTPLQGRLTAASPIRLVLRRLLADGACNRSEEGTVLEAVPQVSVERVGDVDVSVVTIPSPVTLPSRRCVTVSVTSDLRDLSGRSAIPASFDLITLAAPPVPLRLDETFATPAGQESLLSGGIWANGARPGLIGGDGRHGSFRADLGTNLGPSNGRTLFEWNLGAVGGFRIPASNSVNGQEYNVTDSRFFFTDFVLPETQAVRFIGTTPPQIFVRGRVDIRGTIEVNGGDLPAIVNLAGQRVSTFNARGGNVGSSIIVSGQPGTAGGIGGGRGGRGGDEAPVGAPIIVSGVNTHDGAPGQTVQVAAGHAYAGLAGGTGGPASPLHPAGGTGPASALTPLTGSTTFRSWFSRGGGGGGFMLAGGSPIAPTITPATVQFPVGTVGPAVAGGVAFPLLPFPASPPPGYSSLNHYMVGGSGGGGGGSHAYGLLVGIVAEPYMAGSGGSGGGGTFAIRAGGSINIAGTARLEARGGRGAVITGDNPETPALESTFGISSPGGGGSGGSVLLQSGRDLLGAGTIDTSGGGGSTVAGASSAGFPPVLSIPTGAAGSNGFYRLEATGLLNFAPGPGTSPAFVAGTNSGPLADRDALSGDLSTWRASGRVGAPNWFRYELDVDTDGNGTIDVTYTDSGAAGTLKANDPAGPCTILFQGAVLNQAGTAPIENGLFGWREGIGLGAGPGIQQDNVTGFRFQILYNRAAFPNQVVRELRVFAES